MNPRPEGGGETAVYRRNGFSFSLFPPAEAVRMRAVLLTPFGPAVAGNIETAMRYLTGRETYFFDDERTRNRLRILEGRQLLDEWAQRLVPGFLDVRQLGLLENQRV